MWLLVDKCFWKVTFIIIVDWSVSVEKLGQHIYCSEPKGPSRAVCTTMTMIWAWQIGSRVGVTPVFPHLRKVAASSVPELGTGGQTWVID